MANAATTGNSLYARIGGYDVICAIVDEFSQTFANDPRMVRFVSGMNLERQKRNRQLTVDYLCAASGGPALYLGQDMKTAHAGLGINGSEWRIAMDHVQRAVEKLIPSESGKKEFLGLFLNRSHEVIERE